MKKNAKKESGALEKSFFRDSRRQDLHLTIRRLIVSQWPQPLQIEVKPQPFARLFR